jgi:Subunit ChlI of Mg-chelatase
MLARIHSRAQTGVDAPEVTIEAHMSSGLPALAIVGLPEAAVRESKDRVRSALINSRFDFPAHKIRGISGACRPAQGRRSFQSTDRARHSRGFRTAAGGNIARSGISRRTVAIR